MKLLSPVGNFESLKVAVQNGADEVYLGVNDFNARNNIDGFTIENLSQAVDFAHLYGIKVFLAINILFTDSEMQDALNLVVDAYNLGVDAFIMQDLGLISIVYKLYPNVEIHASTQMAIHNLEGALYLKQFGVKRVVLARETPINEIKRIKQNTDLEIEYFCHGALCVCFSGNCYLSSLLNNASGNRGKCKQLCRLPYTLLKGGKGVKQGYLLSAKDFNMIDHLKLLQDAGVDSIKIEGRARRPYYVATITNEYRKALDGLKNNKENILLAFNRGFTKGYFDGNGNILSKFNNHVGIEVGEIVKVNYGKTFNEVFVSSIYNLSPKSTFKTFKGDEEKTSFSSYDIKKVGNLYRITTTAKVKKGEKLRLILDSEKEKLSFDCDKKVKVDIALSLIKNEKIKAKIYLDGQEYIILGEVLESAKSFPITKQEITDNFSKSEFFDANITFDAFDNVFMLKKLLNEFRRKVYDEIFKLKTEKHKKNAQKTQIPTPKKAISFVDFEVVENLDCAFYKKNIIYSPGEYVLEDILAFKEKCEKLNKIAYLDLPNYAEEKDIKSLKSIIEKSKIKVIANNYYALSFDCDKIIGGGLNAYNSYTAQVYNLPILSIENEVGGKINFPYMTLKHCPIKEHFNGDCKNCKYSDDITYKMDSGKILKLKRKKLSTCTFYLTD